MDIQMTPEQAREYVAIPGIKDVTVERHFWAVTAMHAEATANVLSRAAIEGDEDQAAKIAIAREFVVECKLNAVTHAPVPEGMRETAEGMFRLAMMDEGR